MDWNSYFSSVSESDTGREQITYLPLNLLDCDEKNFYSLSDIPALADNIATVGLQQPLRIRKNPDAEGRFLIVSGHRRRAALELLAKDEPGRWAEVACIIQREEVSPALQQLRLIYANAGTRKLSSNDMTEQAAQVEKLLYQLQQEGHEFPGRMRDHVAKVMQTTNTKLAVLKKIREHLAECWQPLYKKDNLPENTAYELAKIPPEAQKILFDVRMQNDPRLGSFWGEDVKAFAKSLAKIDKIKCSRRGRPCECQNVDNKKKRAAALNYYVTCYCTKCCGDCPDLISCKYACPVLADKIKQLKANRKEANRQAKLDQEEKDRPTIELLQKLWFRFGYAREQAGVSIKDALLASKRLHNAAAEKTVKDLENCTAKFNVNTTEAPYGFHYDLQYIKTLCSLADLFGCSVDFLLCRTDVPDMASNAAAVEAAEAPATAEVEFIPGNWYPASVEPPVGWELVLIDSGGYVDTGKYMGCGEYTMDFGDPVVLWSIFPNRDTAEEYPHLIADWLSGIPENPGTYAAYVAFDGIKKPMLRELYWNGEWWSIYSERIDDGVQVLYFVPGPEIPHSGSPLNNSCKTGMSPNGHCGAAASCDEPVECCMNCDKDCNLRCGNMEG